MPEGSYKKYTILEMIYKLSVICQERNQGEKAADFKYAVVCKNMSHNLKKKRFSHLSETIDYLVIVSIVQNVDFKIDNFHSSNI